MLRPLFYCLRHIVRVTRVADILHLLRLLIRILWFNFLLVKFWSSLWCFLPSTLKLVLIFPFLLIFLILVVYSVIFLFGQHFGLEQTLPFFQNVEVCFTAFQLDFGLCKHIVFEFLWSLITESHFSLQPGLLNFISISEEDLDCSLDTFTMSNKT